MADRRLTPARPDLAATHLKGVVDAPRFADGEKFSIAAGRASLRVRPSDDAAQDSELLFGEMFTVYDRSQGCVNITCTDDSACPTGKACVNGYCQDGAGTCMKVEPVP